MQEAPGFGTALFSPRSIYNFNFSVSISQSLKPSKVNAVLDKIVTHPISWRNWARWLVSVHLEFCCAAQENTILSVHKHTNTEQTRTATVVHTQELRHGEPGVALVTSDAALANSESIVVHLYKNVIERQLTIIILF